MVWLVSVSKAVIPAAGLGTRFLPATKAQPKEMLPVVDKPVIQYVVEEAVASGIDDILVVTGRGKRSIEAHFDKSYELEEELLKRGKGELLEDVRGVSDLADIHYVRQKERRGLGDAVLYAERHVGNEPFALLLGDTILRGEEPCTKRLMDVWEQGEGSVVAVEKVPWSEVSRFGIVEPGEERGDGVLGVEGFVEKPGRGEAPSNLGIVGRYVLDSGVFDVLRGVEPGVGGEVQLTDALRELSGVRGFRIEGERFDIGDIESWLLANRALSERRDEYVVVSQ